MYQPMDWKMKKKCNFGFMFSFSVLFGKDAISLLTLLKHLQAFFNSLKNSKGSLEINY